jgi:hypothetical protein
MENGIAPGSGREMLIPIPITLSSAVAMTSKLVAGEPQSQDVFIVECQGSFWHRLLFPSPDQRLERDGIFDLRLLTSPPITKTLANYPGNARTRRPRRKARGAGWQAHRHALLVTRRHRDCLRAIDAGGLLGG